MKWFFGLLFSLPIIFPQTTFAHSFGKLYNLPVPFWMYLYGGAGALIVSFLIIGYFFNKAHANTYSTRVLSAGFLKNKRFITLYKTVGVALFLLTILSGIIGQDASYSNFNMVFFWIVFVLGCTYLTAILGNFYATINPWKTLVEWIESVMGEKIEGSMKYPKNFSYYPSLILYSLFIYVELFGETGPFSLSFFLLQYTMLTLFFVFLFGKAAWFTYGEFFSVFFGLLSKLAPFDCDISTKTKHKIILRPPFMGLLKERAEHISLLLFILFMLSSTAFDGFRETIVWYRIYWQHLHDAMSPILGENAFGIFEVLGLLLSPFIFLGIYLLFITIAKILTKTKHSVGELALQFAFSLIPIAFVYNIAHYYTLLFTEGQSFIRVISDPFGWGWDIFGTSSYVSNLSIIDAGVTWHVQVGVILLGHIISVYIAHLIAMQIFPNHKKALLSQIPTLFIMVAYTIIGLWILAQPITGGAI